MPTLDLKPSHKPVVQYYRELESLKQLNVQHEAAVEHPFAKLLDHCAQKMGFTLVRQHSVRVKVGEQEKQIRFDGAFLDDYKLLHGVWEAKDLADNLDKAMRSKFASGYPKFNTLFQTPSRAILWQNSRQVLDEDISKF